jgi:hypothetical protein
MGRYSFHTILGPDALATYGFNIAVQVSTTATVLTEEPTPKKSINIMAHIDTGTKYTTIATSIAKYLGLAEMGEGPGLAVTGEETINPLYFVDLSFIGTTLSPRKELLVYSAKLRFDFHLHEQDPTDVNNYGLLIGRDIMSRWHMTWDGPTSTVIISD